MAPRPSWTSYGTPAGSTGLCRVGVADNSSRLVPRYSIPGCTFTGRFSNRCWPASPRGGRRGTVWSGPCPVTHDGKDCCFLHQGLGDTIRGGCRRCHPLGAIGFREHLRALVDAGGGLPVVRLAAAFSRLRSRLRSSMRRSAFVPSGTLRAVSTVPLQNGICSSRAAASGLAPGLLPYGTFPFSMSST